MEDILASIRRIIAADHSGPGSRAGLASFARRTAALPASADPVDTLAPEDEIDVVGPAVDPPAADLPLSVSGHRAHAEGMHVSADENGDIAPVSAGAPTALSDEVFELQEAKGAGAVEPLSSVAAYELNESELVSSPERPEGLISQEAGTSISSSFQALAETVLLRDPEMIERMTRDTLRPMLKSWLDDNLPSMVERLVRTEIERVARGGRGRS